MLTENVTSLKGALAVGVSVVLTTVAALAASVPSTVAEISPRAPASIDCKLAKALWREAFVQPAWFPVLQPRGYLLQLNADEPKMAEGLRWAGRARYFSLLRIAWGANFSDPFADTAAETYFDNIGRRIEILRLSDGRLLAAWQTSNGAPNYDYTYLVSKGETLAQFTEFLRSLRPVRWPSCCA